MPPKADPPKSLQEQLPLIVGSITAAMVFIIAVVVIAIVCLRSEQKQELRACKTDMWKRLYLFEGKQLNEWTIFTDVFNLANLIYSKSERAHLWIFFSFKY